MTRTIQRAARLGSVILATGAIAAIAPTAAQADTAALTIDYISCSSGGGEYYCQAFTSGGVGPVTVTYSPRRWGTCRPNSLLTMTAVATDTTGGSVSKSHRFFCSGGLVP